MISKIQYLFIPFSTQKFSSNVIEKCVSQTNVQSWSELLDAIINSN